jgi:hypothetical protein
MICYAIAMMTNSVKKTATMTAVAVSACCDFLKGLNDLCLAVAWYAAQGFDGAAVQDDPAHFKEQVRLSMRQDR